MQKGYWLCQYPFLFCAEAPKALLSKAEAQNKKARREADCFWHCDSWHAP
jgi:hypothetical protein